MGRAKRQIKQALTWLKFRLIGWRYNAYAVGVSNFGGSRRVFFMDYDAHDWSRLLGVFNGLGIDMHVLSTKHGCLFVSTVLMTNARYMRVLELVLTRLARLGVKESEYRFGMSWIRVSPKYSKRDDSRVSPAPKYERYEYQCSSEDVSIAHVGVLHSLGMASTLVDEHLSRNRPFATLLQQKIYRTRD